MPVIQLEYLHEGKTINQETYKEKKKKTTISHLKHFIFMVLKVLNI